MSKKAFDYYVDTAEVGKRIRSIRKKQAISVSDMADFFGMYPQTIYKWERGDTLPDIDNLIALSNYLNVSIDLLLTGKEFSAA